MNLVDYGSSEDEQPVAPKRDAPDDDDKRDDESNKKQKVEPKKSTLPPLPEEFDEPPPSNHITSSKGDAGRNLVPPQLWRKKANISTEDITWNSNPELARKQASKKANKSPAK